MNETGKVVLYCLSGFVLVLAVFFGIRCIDLIFLHAYSIPEDSIKPTAEAFVNAFQGYRDFVTVITGLLTLFVGATGFAAFFSFRKLREDEKSIIAKMEKEEVRIEELRKRLEAREKDDGNRIASLLCDLRRYIKIQQARVLLEAEADKSTAVDVLESSEDANSSDRMFHQLKGDAYYFRGRHGDYLVAIDEYKNAIQCNERSPGAWFGLAQAKYRSVSSKGDEELDGSLDLRCVDRFKLKENKDTVTDIEMVKEAIKDVNRAISYGATPAEAGIELGHMYKAIGDQGSALAAYKGVLDINQRHTACGFFYCHLWILKNLGALKAGSVDKESLEEAVSLLKLIGLLDVYNSKVAYALLWYLYRIVPDLGSNKDVVAAFSSTTKYTIYNLFSLAEETA
jgi:tetratricopeptide (TPR) repeat protein